MSDQQGYNNILKRYRKQYLESLEKLESDYDDLLEEFLNRLRRINEDYANEEGTFDEADLDNLQNEMDGLSYWLATETRDLIDSYIRQSAELAIEGHDRATEYVLRKFAERQDSEHINQLVERALEGVDEEDA